MCLLCISDRVASNVIKNEMNLMRIRAIKIEVFSKKKTFPVSVNFRAKIEPRNQVNKLWNISIDTLRGSISMFLHNIKEKLKYSNILKIKKKVGETECLPYCNDDSLSSNLDLCNDDGK